jgi:hypothetical protein
MNLSTRLEKLEQSSGPATDRRVVQIIRRVGETQDAAVARWHAEHPDEAPLVDDDNTLIITRVLTRAPQPNRAG